MTVRLGPICLFCVHYQGIPNAPAADLRAEMGPRVGRCTAFGDAPIPTPIWRNRADHRQSIEGDHGIQYQPYDEDGAQYAALLFHDDTSQEPADEHAKAS